MIYTFGDYELDTQLYELRHVGKSVPLEPIVFKVLLYLVRNRERAVSKDELLEHLWANQCVGEWVLVQSVVKSRRALGDDGHSQHCIQTIRGYGYRFVAGVQERSPLQQGAPHAFCLPNMPCHALGTGAMPIQMASDEVMSLGVSEHTRELTALAELLRMAQSRLAALLHVPQLNGVWAYAQTPGQVWPMSQEAPGRGMAMLES